MLKWQCDEYQKSMFEVASSGAEDGNAMSMVQLGRCYRDGIGTDPDLQKARQWFSDSVNYGADWAKNELLELDIVSKGCPFWKK